MNNIFDFAAACLHNADIDAKLALTHQAWRQHQAGELDFNSLEPPQPIGRAVFPERPQLLDPRLMPRRKMTTLDGLKAFFMPSRISNLPPFIWLGTCFTAFAACPGNFTATGCKSPTRKHCILR